MTTSPTMFESVRSCTSDLNSVSSTAAEPTEAFNPIFGRPPLIRLETLSSAHVRWLFFIFYFSLAVTMFFRIEQHRIYTCDVLCPNKLDTGCKLSVPSPWTPQEDAIHCSERNMSYSNISSDGTATSIWSAELHDMTVFSRYMYLYISMRDSQSFIDHDVQVTALYEAPLGVFTEVKKTFHWKCEPNCDEAKKITRFDFVHEAESLVMSASVKHNNNSKTSTDTVSDRLVAEVVSGNTGFSKMELSVRCLCIAACFIILIRLMVMLSLSGFEFWFPEHLWLLYVIISVCFILCNPWWYWTLEHEDFSTDFEKFKYVLHILGYDFCADILRAFEFIACCSLRDAGTESYWFKDKVFWPAVAASCWLILITITRVLQLLVSRNNPWVYGVPLFENVFTNFIATVPIEGISDPSRNLTSFDYDIPLSTGGVFNYFNSILFRALQLFWYPAIILQAFRTSTRLRSIPYLQSRYRQLTFRFAVYLYLCYIVTWVPPVLYHTFTNSATPPTTPYNIGEVIGSVAYSCILAYVCTPITDYQHKLVYNNEIPDPGNREWINNCKYNPGFRRFLASSQSLFFFFTEEERDRFITAQDKAVDSFLASRAQIHYSSSGIPHLFEHLSLSDAKTALVRAKEQAMSGIKSGKDRVLRSAASLPTTVASIPSQAKEAAVKSATAVKKGMLHPVDTATNVSSRTVEIFEQTLEKIHPKSETVDKIKTGVHGALGLPVVLGKRENDNMTVTVSPPSPNESEIDIISVASTPTLLGSPEFGASQSGSFRKARRRSDSNLHDKDTITNRMLGWFDKISSDVSSIQTEPEPLFCLETCSKLFNLSWEVYFLDPASSDEVRQELQRTINKRAKARGKIRKTNPDSRLKIIFRKIVSHPSLESPSNVSSPQGREMRSIASPSSLKKSRSGRLSSLSALKRNTFINKKHLLRVRTRYEASDGPKERERLLLEALEDKLEMNVRQYGYSLEKVVANKQNQALICKMDEHLVIAFRGTDNTENLKSDLKMTREDIENWVEPRLGLFKKSVNAFGLLRPKVHRGFLEVWREYLKSDVMEALRDVTKRYHINRIYLTGHSLGGALACLAAWDIAHWVHDEIGLDSQNRPAISLTHYSFGCPRVGNPEFSKLFNKAVPDSFRIVNDGDPVCFTPPKIGYGVASLYSHPGKLVKVDWKGNFVIRPGYVEKSMPSWHLRSADPSKHQMAGSVTDFSAGKTISYRSALDAVFSYCNFNIRCFDPLLSKIANNLEASVENARQGELLDFPIFSPFSSDQGEGNNACSVRFNREHTDPVVNGNQRKESTDSSLRSVQSKRNPIQLDRDNSLGSVCVDHEIPTQLQLPSFVALPHDRLFSVNGLLDNSGNTDTVHSLLNGSDHHQHSTLLFNEYIYSVKALMVLSGCVVVIKVENDKRPSLRMGMFGYPRKVSLGLVSDSMSQNSSTISPLCILCPDSDSCLTTPQLASGGASSCSSGKSRSIDGKGISRQNDIQQMMLRYGYSPYTPLKPFDLHRSTPPPLTPPKRVSHVGHPTKSELGSQRTSLATVQSVSLPSQVPYPSEVAMDYLFRGMKQIQSNGSYSHVDDDDDDTTTLL